MLESEVCRVDPGRGQLLVRRQAEATGGKRLHSQPGRLAGEAQATVEARCHC